MLDVRLGFVQDKKVAAFKRRPQGEVSQVIKIETRTNSFCEGKIMRLEKFTILSC